MAFNLMITWFAIGDADTMLTEAYAKQEYG